MQHLDGIDAANSHGNRQAHRIAQSYADNNGALAHQFATASQAFHAQRSDAAPVDLCQYLGLEAAESRVQAIERHLHGVERDALGKTLKMNIRLFMSGETEKPLFALLLAFEQSLPGAIRSKDKVRIVFVDHLVYLP